MLILSMTVMMPVRLAGDPDEELGSCLGQALSCTLGQTL